MHTHTAVIITRAHAYCGHHYTCTRILRSSLHLHTHTVVSITRAHAYCTCTRILRSSLHVHTHTAVSITHGIAPLHVLSRANKQCCAAVILHCCMLHVHMSACRPKKISCPQGWRSCGYDTTLELETCTMPVQLVMHITRKIMVLGWHACGQAALQTDIVLFVPCLFQRRTR